MNMMNQSYVNFNKSDSSNRSIQAFMALIGIICHILSIFVFGRKKLKNFSYSVYWRIKAVCEILVLLKIIQFWTTEIIQVNNNPISDIFCRLTQYSTYVPNGISLCLELIITLDRFFTIIYSNRFGFIKKRSFQIAIISLVVAYNILINVIFQLNYRLNKVKDTWICQVQIDEYKISWTIGLIETFIVNLFVNPIIDFILIRRIIVTRRNVRPINRTIINDRKFAISAIGLNTSSVLLKIPFVLNNLLSIYLNVGPEIASRIYTISLLIVMIDKIDIFFVNMLVNSIFRQEFFNMIKSINNNKKANNKNFINKNTRAQSSLRVREFSRLIPRSPYNI